MRPWNAAEALACAHNARIELVVRDGRLWFRAPAGVDEELVAGLRRFRVELAEALERRRWEVALPRPRPPTTAQM
jgi:hypothetical protein